ncbi:TPA: DNA cytosine methyltransferase [Clostridioides difficile]|uniref:DNA cytosine methyltransferase n=1 Tax=Clostridioides difficile TaxID=1496 RepID=UPI00374FC11F
MNVLSLFDGISCGQVAFERAGIKVDNYFASEIKKSSIKVTMDNYPNTIQLGDVRELNVSKIPNIDILIGGSPCQNLSRGRLIGNKIQDGLSGDRSNLFWEYVRILKQLNPKYFLLENVVMPEKDENMINQLLGVEPIRINSNLVSYQNRDRLYWTNIPNVQQPKDLKISFQNFKDTDFNYCKKFKVKKTPSREKMWGNGLNGSCKNITYEDKINCVTLKQDRFSNSGLVEFGSFCRYLTTRELELAQTLPVGYTKLLSRRQAENVIGDGWTIDVIAHILSNIN